MRKVAADMTSLFGQIYSDAELRIVFNQEDFKA